ncbi:MAG: glycosyltransferase family 4 protein [Actinobacteria bacterium]|nr:glycosyltransferase family 4 protein [Actinomycetota bacterium]
MSRFPKVSETFVIDEITAVEQRGVSVEILPLIHHRDPVAHPAAIPLEARAHYIRPWSPAAIGALIWWFVRHPGRTARAIATALAGNRASVGFLIRTAALIPQAAWFARWCATNSVEHVHAHFATHAATNAWLIWRLTDIPYSFTAHAHDIYVDTTFLDRKIHDASAVIAISEYGRDRLAAIAPAEADLIHVVHLGVDLSDARNRRNRRRLNRRDLQGPARVLCVARFNATKGHDVLLDALALLVSNGTDAELTLIGDGELRPAIEEQVERLGLSGSVRFLGPRSHDDVFNAMESADVVVSASVETPDGDAEGIPVTLMEAMAIGVPVVATRTAGVPELITDEVSGLLVDQRDAVALAESIRRILGDAQLADRLTSAAAVSVEESFDREEVVSDLLETFLGRR